MARSKTPKKTRASTKSSSTETVVTKGGPNWTFFGFGVAFAVLALLFALPSCPNLEKTFRGKHVVLTGASSGIGREMALQLSKLGASLTIIARRENLLNEVKEEGLRLGAGFINVQALDMSEDGAVESLVNSVHSDVSYVVANHAVADDAMFMESKSVKEVGDLFEWVLRTNVVGSAKLAYGFLNSKYFQRGQLVIVSSGTAAAPSPFHGAYVSSKRALTGLADTLRAELALVNHNVSVSVHILGLIGTEAVLKDEGNRQFAMPIDECVRQMLCSMAKNERQPLIPRYIGAFITLGHFFPAFTEHVVNIMYTFNVQDYIHRIATLSQNLLVDQ